MEKKIFTNIYIRLKKVISLTLIFVFMYLTLLSKATHSILTILSVHTPSTQTIVLLHLK